jgi:hypothetical protein
MPRGYRCIVLAVFGFLILAGAQEQPSASTVPEKSNARNQEQAEQGCNGTSQPTLSCDAISAQAAVDQVRDADQQISAEWWGIGVGALTLVAAVFAAYYAKEAARHTQAGAVAASENLAAFIAVEDASVVLSIPAGHLVTGTVDRFSMKMAISNVGRSAAFLSRIDFGGENVGHMAETLEPGKTYSLPGFMHFDRVDGGTPISGYVEYSTALHNRSKLRVNATIRQIVGTNEPLAFIERMWIEAA